MPSPRRPAANSVLAPLAGVLLLAFGCSRGPSGEGPSPEVEPLAPPFVELTRLTGPPTFGGEAVAGGKGDWLLRNERLAVVVSGIPDGSGKDSPAPGRLIDAAPTGGEDLLRLVDAAPTGGEDLPRRVLPAAGPSRGLIGGCIVDSLFAAPGEEAVLVARGRASDVGRGNLTIETRYRLRPASNVLSISMRFENRGPDTLAYRPSEVVLWGEAEPFAPGPGFRIPERGEPIPFLTAVARGTAYAWWDPAGDLTARAGATWTHLLGDSVTLAPGATLYLERRLTVRRGTAADAAFSVWSDRSAPLAFVTVEAKHGHEPVAGARVEIRSPDGRAWSWGETSAQGRVQLCAPPGSCVLVASHPSHGIAPVRPVSVGARDRVTVALRLLDAADLDLRAVDTEGGVSPARWELVGIAGTADPWFGPRQSGGGAGNTQFTETGAASVRVPPGRYRVRATRGPAYERWEQEVTLEPGSRTALRAELAAIGVPSEWLLVETAVLDRGAPECAVAPADRIRQLA